MSVFAAGMTGTPMAVMASAQSFAASQCLGYYVGEGVLADENPPHWAWKELSQDHLQFVQRDPGPIALRSQTQFFDSTVRRWFPTATSPLYDEIPAVIRHVLETVPGSLSHSLLTNSLRATVREFLGAGAQELFRNGSSLDQLRRLEEAHAAAIVEPDLDNRARALCEAATEFVHLGDYQRAIAIFEQAANASERMPNREQQEAAARLIKESITASGLNQTEVVERFVPPSIAPQNPHSLAELWEGYSAMQLELDRTGVARGLLPLMFRAAEGAFYEDAAALFAELIPRIHPSHYPEMRISGLDVEEAFAEIGEYLSRMALHHDLPELGLRVMRIVQEFDFLPFRTGSALQDHGPVIQQHLPAQLLVRVAEELKGGDMPGHALEFYAEALMQTLVLGEGHLFDVGERLQQQGWAREIVEHFAQAMNVVVRELDTDQDERSTRGRLGELAELLAATGHDVRPEAVYHAALNMIRYIDGPQLRGEALKGVMGALARSALGSELYSLYHRVIALSDAEPELLKLTATGVADSGLGEESITLFQELVEAGYRVTPHRQNEVWGHITRELDRIGIRSRVEVPRAGPLGFLSHLRRYRLRWVAKP